MAVDVEVRADAPPGRSDAESQAMARFYVVLGRRLRLRRQLMGMTQKALGALAGVTFQQIAKYECAFAQMSVTMLWKLSRKLEVDIDYFFPGAPRSCFNAEAAAEIGASRRRIAGPDHSGE